MIRITKYISKKEKTCHVAAFISWRIIVTVQFNN